LTDRVLGRDFFKSCDKAGYWWHTLVIPATRKAKVRRIPFPGQPRQKVPKIAISTNTWAQGCTPFILDAEIGRICVPRLVINVRPISMEKAGRDSAHLSSHLLQEVEIGLRSRPAWPK
jgi:hypothetical protein